MFPSHTWHVAYQPRAFSACVSRKRKGRCWTARSTRFPLQMCSAAVPRGIQKHVFQAYSSLPNVHTQPLALKSSPRPQFRQGVVDLTYQSKPSLTVHSGSGKSTWYTCKRCKTGFSGEANHDQACRYHLLDYSGGEVSKALGFVRRSDAAEDQLRTVVGRTGLIRFWDCCGAEHPDAEGCMAGWHLTYDNDLNEQLGWK